MVSLNTILGVGGIAVAYFIFKNLGGASGIGSQIGSGFSSFGTALSQSLNPLKTAFGQSPQLDMTYERYLKGQRTADTLPFDKNPSFIIPQPESTAVTPAPNDLDFNNFYNKFIDILPLDTFNLPNVYASESPQAQNYFGGQRTMTTDRSVLFPNARTATSSEKSYLRNLGIG